MFSARDRVMRGAGWPWLCCALLFTLTLTAGSARADWQPDGVPVCTAENYQGSLGGEADGLGGMVMAWQDHRAGLFRIYAQRLDGAGELRWTDNGVPLRAGGDQQFHPDICATGTGGAWVVWNDREGGYGSIYVQRLDDEGEPDWAPAGGQSIATGSDWVDNLGPVCAGDGFGGVVVAWIQEINPPSGDFQVVAQRIDAQGAIRWAAGGVVIGDDIGAGEELDIVSNEERSYGAFLGWRSSIGAGKVQWVDTTGSPRWGSNGHNLGLVTAGSRVRVADRRRISQGVYVMYRWYHSNGFHHVNVAAVDSATYEFWDEVVDYGSGGNVPGDDYRLVDNGQSGVVCVWDRFDAGQPDGVYIRNLDYDGDTLWGPRLVSDEAEGNALPDAAIQYGYWGTFISWVGEEAGQPRLKYSLVERTYGYPSNDVLVPGGYASQRPVLVTQYDLGAVPLIAWMDERGGVYDIYASGLEANGDPLHANLAATSLVPAIETGDVGGDPHAFYVTVKNLGGAPSGESWVTIFPNQGTPPEVGDEPPVSVQSLLCPGLAPGDSLVAEILIDAPDTPQTWTMWGFADYRGDVEEFGQEADNIVGPVTYEWEAQANLVVVEFYVSNHHPRLGEEVLAGVQIRNTGNADAGPFDIDFYENLAQAPGIGQVGDQTWRRNGLAAGGGLTMTLLPFTCMDDLDDWHCYVQVDTQGEVSESSESDNLGGPLALDWQVPFQEGWPVAGEDFNSSPAIAPFLMVTEGHQAVVASSASGKVFAWNPQGNEIGGWPFESGQPMSASPAVGNVTGSSLLEVIAVDESGRIYCLSQQGALLWQVNLGAAITATPALANLAGDSQLEIVVGTEGGRLFVLDGEGGVLPGWPLNLGEAIFASPAVGQLDGSGPLEIVAVGSSGDLSSARVFLLTPAGTVLNDHWPVAVDAGIVSSPALGDLNGDDNLEIVVGDLTGRLHVWDVGAHSGPFPVHLDGPILSSPALGDVIEGDGILEIVVATQFEAGSPPFEHFESSLYAIDSDGQVLPNWPLRLSNWMSDAQAGAGPVIWGGGRVPAANICISRYSGGCVTALGTGSPVDGMDMGEGGPILGSPALGDIDGDGHMEIVVPCEDQMECYSLVHEAFDPAELQWPMFGHDWQRTRCFGFAGATDVAQQPTAALRFCLEQNHPNPFNPQTEIGFSLGAAGPMELRIFDARGRAVRLLASGQREAGAHRQSWDGRDDAGRQLASGVYFYRLEAEEEVQIRRMLLLK